MFNNPKPVRWQDGDGEELYLDQLFDALVPLDTLPVDKSRNTDANDKYVNNRVCRVQCSASGTSVRPVTARPR